MPPKDQSREGQSRRKKSEERKKRGYFRARPRRRRPPPCDRAGAQSAVAPFQVRPGECSNFQPTAAPSGVGASVCVRTSGCRQNSAAAVSTAPRPSSPSPWTEPTSFRDPSVPSTVHPRLLRVRVTEPAPPAPAYLSARGRACVLACLERVFHFGWLVARAPLSLPPPPFSVAARQAGRQAGPPSLPLARALRFGESVFQPLASAAVAAACPPTAACNGRTQTVTRWQPLSLVVSQVPLRSAIWCSESDHLTRGKEFARRRRQRDATQTQDIVLRRTRTALRTSGRG